jgi:hypothetical protein
VVVASWHDFTKHDWVSRPSCANDICGHTVQGGIRQHRKRQSFECLAFKANLFQGPYTNFSEGVGQLLTQNRIKTTAAG